jgi:hypothetical protein
MMKVIMFLTQLTILNFTLKKMMQVLTRQHTQILHASQILTLRYSMIQIMHT